MPARNAGPFDEYVGMRRHLPVQHATFNAEGEAESNGVDWGDFNRMGSISHKLNAHRRNFPAWAMNDAQLRAVMVRYVELRACFKRPQPGTDAERLKRAEALLAARTLVAQATLTKLCKEHLALKRSGGDAGYIRKLGEEIEGIDTAILINKNIAGIALRLAVLYWRQGFNSVECASEVHLKPPHCRMMLMRLCTVAAQLGLGAAPANNPGKRVPQSATTPRLCKTCGAPRGRGCLYCDACGQARKVANSSKSDKRYKAKLKAKRRAKARALQPTRATKRLAIVSSPAFIKLFENWQQRRYLTNRTHCKNGHEICAANAHVGDLKRLKRYACDPCWKEYARCWAQQHKRVTARG
jgi:hypothetical protein